MPEIIRNKKAYFNYEILETYEAGLVLQGFEVKAVRAGKVNLAGTHVVIRKGGVWLLNCDVAPYQPNNTPLDYDSTRSRRLLLTTAETNELIGKSNERGLTIVPLRVYTKGRLIKLEIGLVRGKKKHDKRETIKKRESQREIERTLKN